MASINVECGWWVYFAWMVFFLNVPFWRKISAVEFESPTDRSFGFNRSLDEAKKLEIPWGEKGVAFQNQTYALFVLDTSLFSVVLTPKSKLTESAKKKSCSFSVRGGRWHIITVLVLCWLGFLTCYLIFWYSTYQLSQTNPSDWLKIPHLTCKENLQQNETQW